MFPCNYAFSFSTYSLTPANNNLVVNLEYSSGDNGIWCLLYHGYSPDLKKVYMFVQF